jgi:predicted small secreted protein
VNLIMMTRVTKYLGKVWRRTTLLVVCSIVLAACATSGRDGLDVAQLPEAVRPDYQLFARRCSKCHSLARPLGSGITDDEVWIAYVNRMRRQPGSGISPQDTTPILRFLHFYSVEQRRLKRMHDEASAGSAAPAYSAASGTNQSQAAQTANR